MTSKVEEQTIVQENKPGSWQDKLAAWRVNSEKHWAWRTQVAKFLRDKSNKEKKESDSENN